jgi:hypothetical protein
MMRNRIFGIFLVFVWLGCIFPVSAKYYRIVSQNEDGITLEVQFPEVQQIATEEGFTRFKIAGLNQNYAPGFPLLPVLSIPLTLPDCRTEVQVQIEKSEQLSNVKPLIFNDKPNTPIDYAGGDNLQAAPIPEFDQSRFPTAIAEISELGVFREHYLSRLQVYPLQINGSSVRFFRKMRIYIRFIDHRPVYRSLPQKEAALLSKFVANSTQLSYGKVYPPHTVPAPAYNPVTAADTRVKLIVDQNGIYKVTGDDLAAANVDLSAINPSQMRLTNRGKDVPIFLRGVQDGTFDPGDVLEFWGKRNERTFTHLYPDVYADPFSDENVYWLSWDGRAGARIIEENGSIVKTRSGQYNPSAYFTTTVHIEQDNYFERFGQANQEQLSYKRDHWFFDGGIKAVGKRPYTFELVYPEPISFDPVYVKVMMSGLSFKQALGNIEQPHQAMVWLNNAFVGQSRSDWFSQDTATITNFRNSTIRNADLQHGTNTLEVQMPVLPDVGNPANPSKGTDIVLLNWFEITYDRQYKAHNDYIEFTKPTFIPFPNIDLFQFELDNFNSPDVEIYKIGVSKIVNFKIELINEPNNQHYKVTFQDNIQGNDVRYVALTESQKKKPLRIEIDRPWDKNAPEKVLRSTANTADYLIITHGKLLSSVQQLADYRRGQGATVEVVDVQEIYDEFNYGIKSPLAIQDFLRYAFFNWNRNTRLKYVLFFGSSNFNYKRRDNIAEDLVPTFLYQTEKFGAVSSDYPYSLVAGNDELPDLFVGRLPARTPSEVTAITNKIIEYEQNAPKAVWRNQALFISGNDRATYELQSQFGNKYPAFRSQNSRIIESILPASQSAFRLNTVLDTTKAFDPNFGSTTDLIDRWDNGLFMINFMGHGGGYIWADAGLMQLSDVERLNNKGKYPFVTSMTCFTGAFENPNRQGLAAKLVLTPDKGAIGAVASSGLGYLHNDYAMMWEVGQFLFNPDLSVGEIFTLGKILYYDTGDRYNINGDIVSTIGYSAIKHEMIYQYNLISDPFLKLQYTTDSLTIQLNTNTPQPGQTLEVSISSDLQNADGYAELVDNDYNIVNRVPLFGVSGSTTVLLPIPSDFPSGKGLIRAYLSDGNSDRNGSQRIGIDHAAVTAIQFDPPKPDVDDTVSVQMRIVDAQGIRRVYLFRDGVKTDTIFAIRNSTEPDLYEAKLTPTFELRSVFFNIYVENTLGNVSLIPNQSYTVTDIRPDLKFVPNSMRFAGKRAVELQIAVENAAGAGDDNQVGFRVHFAEGLNNIRSGNYFATTTGLLGATDSVTVSTRFTLLQNRELYDLYALVEVDPSENIEDFNHANDTLRTVLKREIYGFAPGRGDTILFGNSYQVMVPSTAIADSLAMRIRTTDFSAPQDQPGLVPIPLLAPGTLQALELRNLRPEAPLTDQLQVVVNLDTALIDNNQININDITLYQKSGSNTPWTATGYRLNSATMQIVATVSPTGLFAPFVSDDKRPPEIELTVDGRPLRGSGLVSKTPSLYLLIQDESGVNTQKDKVQILLNDLPVPEEKLVFPDTLQKNNMLGITIFPELAQGSHQLQVVTEDVNGNKKNSDFELVVAEGFDIIVYGNYPNPFVDQTIFSYFVNLNDDLDEFEIRIYTVSGRLIRRLDSDINNDPMDPDGGARRKGYNELIWDGTDNDGNEVANGVYFAVLRGTYEGKTVEKILKVAKLR